MTQIELSVVVPVYNVESYLAECLDSLLEQLLDDSLYEIIAINDGSTDSSLEILNRYEKKHANIHVYSFENSGLGAVRNKGIQLASGKYIAFIDSDDIIPSNAFYQMVNSLNESGSQIVTGPVQRFESGQYSRSGLHKKVKFVPIKKTTIGNYPTLIYDTTSTNKMYDLAFLKQHQITFPEKIAYEDMLFTLKAYCLSTSIDVIDTIVYIWRIRSGESVSISQNRFIIQSFEDRISTLEDMIEFAETLENDKIRRFLAEKIVTFDLPIFSPNYEQTSSDFIDYYVQRVPKLLEKLAPDNIFDNDYRIQTVYNAIAKKDNTVLKNYSLEHVKTMKIDFDDQKELVIQDDYLPLAYQSQLDFTKMLPFTTEMYDVDYRNDEIILNGMIKSQALNLHNDHIEITAYLKIFGQKDTAIELKVIPREKVEGGRSISVVVPPQLLTNPNECYNVAIVSKCGKYSGESLLSTPRTSASRSSLTHKTTEQAYQAKYNFAWELELTCQPIKFVIKTLAIENDQLILKGDFPTTAYRFALINTECKNRYSEVADGQLIFDLTGLKKNLRYQFAVLHNGLLSETFRFEKLERFFYRCESTANQLEEYTIRLFTSHGISLGKDLKTSTVKLANFDKTTNHLKLMIECPIINLVGEVIKTTINIQSLDGRYSLEFPASLMNTEQVLAEIKMADFIPYDNYKVYIKLTLLDGTEVLSQILDTNRAIDKKANHTMDNHRITLFRRVVGKLIGKKPLLAKKITNKVANQEISLYMKDGHQLFLDVQPRYAWFEKTVEQREKNKGHFYPLFRKLSLDKKIIIFDSYWSEQFSCSPKALYNQQQTLYPDMKSVWAFTDEDMPINGSGLKVRRRSLKYWYYLARASFIVHNTNMPTDYEKRAGQKELFIPHGSFMKVMGYDTPEIKLATTDYRKDFDKRISNWDSVSIPSDYMAEKVKSAFNFNGEIIKEGLPRNTLIYTSSERIDQIKEKLQIDPNKKVLLYAPTWRENKQADLKLNLELLQKELPDTILLVRLHYFVSRAVDVSAYSPFVMDVSNHQDIEELYAISDALITDYSSVMFDFAFTKKPMLFFCYDLEHYQNSERGTYLDYVDIVPGLIARETTDMVTALKDLSNYEQQYEEKYQHFFDTFCQYGKDQDSSRRLLKQFLGK